MFAPRVLRITILAEVIYFTLSERRATIDHCHPYEKVPVLNGCYDQITIEGETVKYSCSFGDNYLAADVVYWRLRLEDRSIILIENKKNYTNFHMDAHQDCPLTNNSCCKFISELSIHTDLSMNDAILYCYALINGFTSDSMCNLSVVTKPKITVPLNNVRTKEGETVVLESLVTAVTISGWMLFTWKKNDHVINSNPHKYNFTTEINPYNNSIKYLLTIHSVSKEDDANYTLIVYYNADILKQHGITGDFSNQTTGVLQVDSKVNISLILGIATAAAVLVATILVVIFVCTIRKRKSCSARLKNRSAKSIISPLRIPDETSPLLPPSNHDGSDNDIQECSPVPATSDNNTILPDSEVVTGESEGGFHADRHRDKDLQTDRPLNQATAHTSPGATDNSTKKFLSYRPHMQAIKDHVVCKVAPIAFSLALKFGVSKEQANDLAKTGNGQIEIFRIWLKTGSRTWKELLDVLHKMNEGKLADELQDKLKNELKVILDEMLAKKPSMYSLYDVIQQVAPCCHNIAVELGLDVYYRILETDHPNDCTLRCRRIFEEFLIGNDPTWKKVIDAIKNVGHTVVADNIEKQLPEILDKEGIRAASLEQESLKVDMLILLLSMQSEISKIPSVHQFGWLVDVQVIVKRISPLVPFSDNELQMINDANLDSNHRSLCLARLIKDKGKRKAVYQKLRDFYCVAQTAQPTAYNTDKAMTSEACSHEASSHSTIVYSYGDHHHYYPGSTPLSSPVGSGLAVGTQETGKIKKSKNPLSRKTIDFFRLVNSESLTPHLYQNELITEDDYERVQLPNMTSNDRVTFLYLKLVRLGEDGFKAFMDCLRDAKDHLGHEELYHILLDYIQ